MNRRSFLYASGGLGLSPFVTPQGSAPSTVPPDISRRLAHHIVSTNFDQLSAAVRKEGSRTLLNWIGCALGGSKHEAVGIAVSALSPFSGPAQASLLGRTERLDIMNAALINGIASHVLDYDDT